jgi:SAM-dependent methyltransferase
LEDYEFWVRAATDGSRMLHNPATLALYRQRSGGKSEDHRKGLCAQRDVLLDLVNTAQLKDHSSARALAAVRSIEEKVTEMDAVAARDRLEEQIDSGSLRDARRLLWAARGTYPAKWKLVPALAVMIVSPWLFARLARAWRRGVAVGVGGRGSGPRRAGAKPGSIFAAVTRRHVAVGGYEPKMMLRKLHAELRARGVSGVARMVYRRAHPRSHPRPLACYQICRRCFRGRIGLEIGGPSDLFRRGGVFPVYAAAARIDNCNFGQRTVWEGAIAEGATFFYDDRHGPGKQYVAEATNLARVASDSYDFVLSSHTLEHTANPLQALSEWTRVLEENGLLVLVVPDRGGTFDHRRPVTSLEHLVRDFDEQANEGDLAHLEEILALHDLSMDPAAGDIEEFRRRSEKNLENRCLHHHVFDAGLMVAALHHAGLQIRAVDVFPPFHILVVAQKLAKGRPLRNEGFRHTRRALGAASLASADGLRSMCAWLYRRGEIMDLWSGRFESMQEPRARKEAKTAVGPPGPFDQCE